MGNLLFDDFSLPIECDDCGHVTEQKWSRLQNDPDIPCPGCGTTIRIDAKQMRELERSIKERVDEMRKKFS